MKKITIALFTLFSALTFAQDGVSDASFGTNGYVLFNTDNGVTLDRKVQPDGTTIYIDNGKFRRLTANGMPDATFGIDGAITIVQSYANYESFTVADNQITLITKGPYDNYSMGRYNFDGTVDATLGTAGQGHVFLNVGTDIKGHIYSEKSPDGKIFIGGNSSTAYGSYNNYYVRRHNTDGTNDSNYNFNAYSLGINISQTSIGYYTEEFSSGIKVRPDGNAVIFGYSAFYESSSSFVSNRRATAAIVAPTGQPIKLMHSYEAFYGWKYDLDFDQNNNTYMLGGQTNFYSTAAPSNSIKKFTPTGNTAMSFGTSGTLTVSLDIDATTKADFRKILIQPDGKILLAGMAATTTTGAANQYPYLVVARYLQNGTLDTTFGTNGYILHDIAHPNTDANRNNITQFYASADFSSIFVGGNNLQNAIILKYSNASMAPLAVPTFNPVAGICAGDAAPALSATSTNGIAGTWSPAVISNTVSGTYTFTPNADQHATTATLSVTVNQPTTSGVTETACESYTWAANGNTYTESGAYTNVTTNAAGCTHTETLNLTINQPTTSSVSETACETFTWAANGNTYTESGAYTNVTTNAAGCTHTETLNLTINNSVATTGDAEQTLEEGMTLSNIAISPSTVVWYASLEDALVPQNAIAASTVLVNGLTYYAVNTTDQGCASEPFAVTVSLILGADSFDNASFGLYPNPTTDIINVKYSAEIDSISISNVLGQPVLTQSINGKEGQIDISHLNSGTYFAKLFVGNSAKTIKIIKE